MIQTESVSRMSMRGNATIGIIPVIGIGIASVTQNNDI